MECPGAGKVGQADMVFIMNEKQERYSLSSCVCTSCAITRFPPASPVGPTLLGALVSCRDRVCRSVALSHTLCPPPPAYHRPATACHCPLPLPPDRDPALSGGACARLARAMVPARAHGAGGGGRLHRPGCAGGREENTQDTVCGVCGTVCVGACARVQPVAHPTPPSPWTSALDNCGVVLTPFSLDGYHPLPHALAPMDGLPPSLPFPH